MVRTMPRSWVATPGWARLGTRVSRLAKVGAAALPAGSSKDCGDGVLQPLVGIGHQFHPADPERSGPQEGQPERAVSLAPTSIPRMLPFGIPRRH